jgi:hypothetical protein
VKKAALITTFLLAAIPVALAMALAQYAAQEGKQIIMKKQFFI